MVNTFILRHISLFRFVSYSLFLLIFSSAINAAQINVAVDRNPVTLNESFQLTFSATSSPDEDPDFSSLNQDFTILNQQQSSQLSWINGNASKTIKWTLTLMAKKSGSQTIPSIPFGHDASKPLTITVNKPSQNKGDSISDALYLDVEATPKDGYVQSQILYTVRFYQRVNIAQATLSEPEPSNTVVESLGKDNVFNTQIKDVNYRVTERRYALYPQQSGKLTIPPLVLTAQVIINDSQDRFNSFFNSQSTQTKRVMSKEITLNILPKPTDFTAPYWLPAQHVDVSQTWSTADLHVKVGEPITRTITLKAKGTTASQLPDLKPKQTDPSLKFYPDQAVTTDQKNNDGITAIREQKIALIPSKAGKFTLAAMDIPWFNTASKKVDVAHLPAVTITAIDAAPATNNNKIKTPVVDQTPTLEPTKLEASSTYSSLWMWLALILALAFIIILVLFIRLRQQTNKTKITNNDVPIKLTSSLKALKKACRENQAPEAQQALIDWGKIYFQVSTLKEITTQCDPNLKSEIDRLNQSLYSQNTAASWQGEDLYQAVIKEKKSSSQATSNDPLSPLYPTK